MPRSINVFIIKSILFEYIVLNLFCKFNLNNSIIISQFEFMNLLLLNIYMKSSLQIQFEFEIY